jgi:hypothetical protein
MVFNTLVLRESFILFLEFEHLSPTQLNQVLPRSQPFVFHSAGDSNQSLAQISNANNLEKGTSSLDTMALGKVPHT